MENMELNPDKNPVSNEDTKPSGKMSGFRLYTWGLAKSGQLGTGKEQTEHTPQAIRLPRGDGQKLTQVACGGLYTAVITEDGQLWTTGCGKYGRLATGSEDNRATFGPTTLPEKVKQISCGSWHGAAVTLTGGLVVWGHRKASAATSAQSSVFSSLLVLPTLLRPPSSQKVAGVACGNNFTLAWTVEGRALAWGGGQHGVLGHGVVEDVHALKPVEALSEKTVVEASAGFAHSAFVTQGGKVYTCGKGKDGALGLGDSTTSDVLTPKVVTFRDNKVKVIKVSCSVGEHHGHTLALTSEGKVYSWGDGYKGKLGLGHPDSSFTPTPIPSCRFNDEKVTVVCAGGIHSSAATAEGSIFTWGCGSDGRLGHPDGEGHRYLFRSDLPRKIEGLKSKNGRALVSCTYYHMAALVD